MEIWKLITAVSLTKAPQMQQTCEKTRVVALAVETELNVLFSDDEDNYGNTSLVKHSINTGNAKPIRQKIRPLNPAVEKQLDAQIEKWLEKDIIEESNSPWSSRLVLLVCRL